MRRLASIFIGLVLIPLILNTSAFAQANSYAQKNLVSNQTNPLPPPALPIGDPNLINPWGICVIPLPGNPFWIADNGTGFTTLYDKTGAMIGGGALGTGRFTVAPPTGSSSPATPAGCVGNVAMTGFNVTAGTTNASSKFIFDTEDGTISGWNGTGTITIVAVDNSANSTTFVTAPGAVYKGLALLLLPNNTGTFLLATNFHSGQVEIYDNTFHLASFPVGAFNDQTLPSPPAGSPGYAPFGIQIISGKVFVTYAPQTPDKQDPMTIASTGFVDVFDPNTGAMLQRIMDSHMNAPWGVSLASANFGAFSNDWLIGNLGDGTINAFSPTTGAFIDQMKDANGAVITNLGLWSLFFDSSGKIGDPDTMYFTAGGPLVTTNGVVQQSQGLFAAMTANPPAPPPTPDFNMSVAPTLQTVTAGQTATYTVTVGSLDGFTSAVKLACAGQQTNATCALSPTSVTPPAGGTITSTVTITTSGNPYTTASLLRLDSSSHLLAMLLPVPALGFLGLFAVASTDTRRFEARKRLRRFAGCILLLLVLLVFLTASGCYKKKTASGTQRSTNTVTITGTSGSLSHTITFTLTVQ